MVRCPFKLAFDKIAFVLVHYGKHIVVFEGPALSPDDEEELMKKWQEILGPSNEVVVSLFFQIRSRLRGRNYDPSAQAKGFK